VLLGTSSAMLFFTYSAARGVQGCALQTHIKAALLLLPLLLLLLLLLNACKHTQPGNTADFLVV